MPLCMSRMQGAGRTHPVVAGMLRMGAGAEMEQGWGWAALEAQALPPGVDWHPAPCHTPLQKKLGLPMGSSWVVRSCTVKRMPCLMLSDPAQALTWVDGSPRDGACALAALVALLGSPVAHS